MKEHRYPRAGRRLGVVLLAALGLLIAACSSGEAPETVEGFWFFSYDGRGAAPDGEAFAYITEEGESLGGGIASGPVGGPLTGSREGTRFSARIEDVSGSPVVSVEGRLDGETASGRWTMETGGSAAGAAAEGEELTGRVEARRFDPADVPAAENPFLGTWNNFEDGGVTTLIFGDDYRFSGSEADLDFTGSYAFDEELGLVGVYEADAESVHMEKLTYRFDGPDTVILNGSVYRRQ